MYVDELQNNHTCETVYLFYLLYIRKNKFLNFIIHNQFLAIQPSPMVLNQILEIFENELWYI